jgi:hypothetical protein
MVLYDEARLRLSVEITRQILSAHALNSKARVIVCHPFDPWSIGGIFRDAALSCGASVLPLGLSAADRSLWPTIVGFKPTVLCGSASFLLSLSRGLSDAGIDLPPRRRKIFHAGEPLTPALRDRCGAAWGAYMVDVYGSAEFDSIASEGTQGSGLILCPDYQYAVFDKASREQVSLCLGLDGELLIKRQEDGRWLRTRDRVLILDRATSVDGLWPGSWKIRHLGRCDHSLSLADGTILRSKSIHNVSRDLPLEGIQVHSSRTTGRSDLKILAAPVGDNTAVSSDMIRQFILAECFELADSVKHGASTLTVELVTPNQLHRTSRGKVATFVEH